MQEGMRMGMASEILRMSLESSSKGHYFHLQIYAQSHGKDIRNTQTHFKNNKKKN